MKKFGQGLLIAAVAALPLGSAVAADDGFSATIGLKAWNNNMNKWAPGIAVGTDSLIPIIGNFESSNETAWIPSGSVRYKNFMVGGSYFAKQTYDFAGDQIDRKEYDVIAGYYVLPTLAIIAGYKQVDQKLLLAGLDTQDWKYKGPIVGLSGSAPLTGGFSLYGTAAVGALKFKPTGSLTSQGIVVNADADYRLGEVGVAYAFDLGRQTGPKALIGTLGYRYQSIVAKQTGLWQGQKGRDTTEGLTLGLVLAL